MKRVNRFSILQSNKKITPAEVKIFKNTWIVLRRNLGYYGVEWLQLFFEVNENHLKYFKFDVNSVSELKSKPALTLHGLQIMRQFSAIADCIDKPEMLFQILNLHVHYHAKRDIRPQVYEDMKNSLMTMLSTTLKFPGDVLQIWHKIVTLLFDTIVDMNDNLID